MAKSLSRSPVSRSGARCEVSFGILVMYLIFLPNHIRVYTGFVYSQGNDSDGLIDLVDLNITELIIKAGAFP
ncbi:hypothetical protein DSM106972_032830 [Dulcicalothrix desertica PCC 7102]|uniref:Uncharacterized protein n=1 Tax=Dulcicalothrix desertica PCC 7102 TaxID=232991 RepID=A0A3S1CF32_9CYAN|nr:hypothetical protein [Dulcicalothrix desertica]RUT06077.1 hypothetical protein DSM106972_032830 [Dulcicalothrix desertica PCC 7102]TWH54260.1 hypothetical protein CAL7102_02277 [Dulcicalothrix desertica PCC 7102]